MGTLTKKFKLIHRVKDDQFDVNAIGHYHLSLELGRDGLRFCVIDLDENRCLWLEDYQFTTIFFTEHLLNQLNLIFEDHQMLGAGFWKSVRLAVKNQPYTLVPHSLFKKDHAEDYLKLLREKEPEEPETVLYYRHPANDIVNIFPIETKVLDWFNYTYPAQNLHITHQASALIEGVLHLVEHNSPRTMYVYVDGSFLTIAVLKEKSLEYCNSFFYATAQDFTYFVMFVMNELKLNPETTKLVLFGGMSHDSTVYNHLYRYVRNVSFGEKPKSLRFSYQFDELLDHQFFTAYSIYLCE